MALWTGYVTQVDADDDEGKVVKVFYPADRDGEWLTWTECAEWHACVVLPACAFQNMSPACHDMCRFSCCMTLHMSQVPEGGTEGRRRSIQEARCAQRKEGDCTRWMGGSVTRILSCLACQGSTGPGH